MNDTVPNRRSPLGLFPGQPAPRLYDRVVEVLRTRHYSRRTEEAYLHWIRRFLLFHKGTRPRAGREQPQPFPDASGRHRKCGRVHGEPGDPSIEGRLRYQNRPGTPGAQGRPDHDGLPARIKSSAQSRLHRERRDYPD